MPATGLAIKDGSAEPIKVKSKVLRSVPAFRRFVAFGCNSTQIHKKTLPKPYVIAFPPRLSLNGAILSREHKLLRRTPHSTKFKQIGLSSSMLNFIYIPLTLRWLSQTRNTYNMACFCHKLLAENFSDITEAEVSSPGFWQKHQGLLSHRPRS